MQKSTTAAKFSLVKTTVTRFSKPQQTAAFYNTIDTSIVPTTSVF